VRVALRARCFAGGIRGDSEADIATVLAVMEKELASLQGSDRTECGLM
jgi:hypothetical protein